MAASAKVAGRPAAKWTSSKRAGCVCACLSATGHGSQKYLYLPYLKFILKCHFFSIALHGIGQVVKVEKYREVNWAIAPTSSDTSWFFQIFLVIPEVSFLYSPVPRPVQVNFWVGLWHTLYLGLAEHWPSCLLNSSRYVKCSFSLLWTQPECLRSVFIGWNVTVELGSFAVDEGTTNGSAVGFLQNSLHQPLQPHCLWLLCCEELMYSDFTCCIYIYIIYMIKNVRTVVSRFTNCRRKAFLRIPRTLPDLVVHLTSLGSKIHVCEAPSDEVRTNALPSFRLTSGWSFLIRLWMKKGTFLLSTPCPLDLQVPLLRFTRLRAVWWFGGMSCVC